MRSGERTYRLVSPLAPLASGPALAALTIAGLAGYAGSVVRDPATFADILHNVGWSDARELAGLKESRMTAELRDRLERIERADERDLYT